MRAIYSPDSYKDVKIYFIPKKFIINTYVKYVKLNYIFFLIE